MPDLTFYDAAFPPNPAPHADGFCFYLPGGDAYHPWTRAEIDAQPARYRLPVFVRSDPPGPGAAADVATAVSGLRGLGAPKGIVVAWDAETSVDAAYIRAVCDGLKAAGYLLIVYGTQGDVMGNDVPDGLYFGADWTDVPHLHDGDAVTQWVSFSGYDLDEAKSSLPFWDARPGKTAPVAPPSPSPVPPWETAMLAALPELALGSDDADLPHWYVHRVQAILNAVYGATLTTDGVFGAETAKTVAAFQGANGLVVDSVIGPASWVVLVTGAAA